MDYTNYDDIPFNLGSRGDWIRRGFVPCPFKTAVARFVGQDSRGHKQYIGLWDILDVRPTHKFGDEEKRKKYLALLAEWRKGRNGKK